MVAQADRAARFLRIADYLRKAPDASCRAFGDELAEWVTRRDGDRMDVSLGFTSHGGLSPRRALALSRRDDLIRGVWREVPEWTDMGAAAASRLMSLSARRYEETRWVREQHHLSAPASEPAATWWRILQDGLPIPAAKRIQQILSTEIQEAFGFPSPSSTPDSLEVP